MLRSWKLLWEVCIQTGESISWKVYSEVVLQKEIPPHSLVIVAETLHWKSLEVNSLLPKAICQDYMVQDYII